MTRHALVLGSFAVLVALPAAAHTFWIEVVPRESGARDVSLFVGDHLRSPEPQEVQSFSRFERFGMSLNAGRVTDLSLLLRLSGSPVAVLPASMRERVVLLDSTRREISLPVDRFRHYLDEEHLDAILARLKDVPPGREIREEYFRCAKAILPPLPGASGEVTHAVGQELEIVPGVDPYAAPPEASIRFQVLLRGRAVRSVTVVSAVRSNGQVTVTNARTSADGVVELHRPLSGDWLLTVVQMEPSPAPQFDWRTVWSSLWLRLP